MRRKIFIHIGTHKTGTTSIQSFLRTHADQLKADGIFVPSSGTLDARSGHHNIAWELRADPRHSNTVGGVAELIEELRTSGEPTAVISSEDFEYLSQYPQQLKQFDERLEKAEYETVYIVFFRNETDYAYSLYAEMITHGLNESFETFARSIRDNGSVTCNGDWYYEFRADRFVERWQAIVGPKLIVSSYDDVVAGVGVLPFFLQAVGASHGLVHESRGAPVLNTRLSKIQAERSARVQVTEELARVSAENVELEVRGKHLIAQVAKEEARANRLEAKLEQISAENSELRSRGDRLEAEIVHTRSLADAAVAEFQQEHVQRIALEAELKQENARTMSAESRFETERARLAALDQSFRGSTSWRITAPMRTVSRAVSVVRRKFDGALGSRNNS